MSQEEEELINRRARALVCSLTASKNRFQQARAFDECAQAAYDEACLLLDSESDDWEDARHAVEKLERIEQEYLEAAPIRQNALLRLGWEMREAHKAGFTI